MAVREIKTTLKLDGEREFNKEISEAARNLRVMGSEMKAASAQYDLTGDRASYLASRSQTLKSQLQQQRLIFDALSKAVESSAKSTGDASSKTDGYRIKMNNAAAAVSKLERELRDTDRELEELGRDSSKVGRLIESGITDAARDAGQSLDDMYASFKADIGSIKGSGMISAMSDLGGMVVGAWQALDSFAEGSRDYNRQLAFLEQNAMSAGQDYETVKRLLFEVAGLTGDMDGAIEGVSGLLASGFDTSEAELAIESLAGAVIRFPETLKFENLATDLQESIKTGEATGAFAELIDRTGGSLDDFKNAMKAAKTEEEKQLVALAFLNAMGLRPAYETFKDMNPELIDAQKATLGVNDAWNTLGGTVDAKITPIKNKITEALTELNRFLNEGLTPAQEAGWRQLEYAVQVGSSGLVGAMPGDTGWYEGYKAFEGLITGENTELREAGKEMIDEAKAFASDAFDGFMTSMFGALWTGEKYDVMDYFDIDEEEMAEEAADAGKKAGEDITEAMDSAVDDGGRGISQAADALRRKLGPLSEEINKAFEAGDNKTGWTLTEKYNRMIERIGELEKAAMLDSEHGMTEAAGDAAQSAMDEAAKEIDAGGDVMGEAAEASGKNAMIDLANGLAEGGQQAIDTTWDVVNAINEAGSHIQFPTYDGVEYYTPPKSKGGANPDIRPSYQISLNVDGKKMATVMTPYVSQMQAQGAGRYS